MYKNELKNIDPKSLTNFVSLYRDKENKSKLFDEYTDGAMQQLQAEGASFLFNTLNKKGIAFLADEVGMGKTIQSLAVCAALWQQKPNARILVLAPRNEIAFNWINEYETFIKVHYKVEDDKVKSKIDKKPINPAIFCTNLYDLTKAVQEKWGKLFIGKISSFSGLLSQPNVSERLKNELNIENDIVYDENKQESNNKKPEIVKNIGGILKKNIKENLPENFFDLIIIDEAHYFRNIDGGSLRVNAAKGFFGSDEPEKLGKRTLLLTATPNHSSKENIKAIVSYFDGGKFNSNSFDEILNSICLRRFRRLGLEGKIKYNYRYEQKVEADFKNDPLSELFFGAYQKKLAKQYLENKKDGKRRNFLGFLEGTEFLPTEAEDKTSEADKSEGPDSGDYSKGNDRDIIINLSKGFQHILKKPPSHPKYIELIKRLFNDDNNLQECNPKKLVFVRRIPSVREIARQTIFKYDSVLLNKIEKAFGKKLSLNKSDFRTHFEEIIGFSDSENEEEDNDVINEAENLDKVPTSKIHGLFKTIKSSDEKTKYTHASKFKLRFNRSKVNIFGVFFSPAPNYECVHNAYEVKLYKSTQRGKTDLDDYFTSCLLHRVENSEISKAVSNLIQGSLIGNTIKKEEKDKLVKSAKVHTLFTLFWEYTSKNKSYNKAIKAYDNLSTIEKECLSVFIEKGVLNASSAIIDLYVAFIEAQNNASNKMYDLYQNFIENLRNNFGKTQLPKLIYESILNFKVLCEKVFNLNSNDALLKHEWKNFWDGQPAYAYSGESKNKRVMDSFNTPFYPDVLISTSVLQEGVNLQYFCDEIIHYGIAWTPGDNEQRVGRIDRMFSLTERQLDEGSKDNLNIIYPYLKNTIDQDHLTQFIPRKYKEENLIDNCSGSSNNSSLNHNSLDYENWDKYLRTPNETKRKDPFPANKKRQAELGECSFEFVNEDKTSDFERYLIDSIKAFDYNVYESESGANSVCIVDPILENKRAQPFIVQMNFDPVISGLLNEHTYTLTLKTPLTTKGMMKNVKNNYRKIKSLYEKKSLQVKICLDNSTTTLSIFGVYLKTEIPVFVYNSEKSLSEKELEIAIKNLINCADEIEQIVFGEQDHQITHIQTTKTKLESAQNSSRLRKGNINSAKVEGFNLEGDFILWNKTNQKDDDIREAFEFNHKNRYVKNLGSELQLSYYANDIQDIESKFLQKVKKLHSS